MRTTNPRTPRVAPWGDSFGFSRGWKNDRERRGTATATTVSSTGFGGV